MATTTHIRGLHRGEDVLLNVTIAGTGSIDGWEFESNLRDPEMNQLVVTKTSADGIAITDAVERKIAITIPNSDTEPLQSAVYEFDCWRVNAGVNTCLCDGTLALERNARHG